jgi:hypothetical protein
MKRWSWDWRATWQRFVKGARLFWDALRDMVGDVRRVRRDAWLQVGIIAFVAVVNFQHPTRLSVVALGFIGALNALFYGLRGVLLRDYSKALEESHGLTTQVLSSWMAERAARKRSDAAPVN